MLICKWEKLPVEMQNEQVRPYYEKLRKRNFSLLLKRIFDIVCSFIMLVLFSWLFIIIACLIKIDSRGPVFYRQQRYTQYGKVFKIHKFRSMIVNADEKGNLITVKDDARVTKIGKIIRKFKIDELAQIIDVFVGNMTFVGTRPEVEKYVKCYSDEMMATLLLPAGITSEASIRYKDENNIISNAEDVDKVYTERVMPSKMKYNLKELCKAGVFHDVKVMVMTVFAVLGVNFKEK